MSDDARGGRGPHLSMVFWGGYVGGAERLSIALAERMRVLGADVTAVYLQEPWSLSQLMATAGVPHRSLASRAVVTSFDTRGAMRVRSGRSAPTARCCWTAGSWAERSAQGAIVHRSSRLSTARFSAWRADQRCGDYCGGSAARAAHGQTMPRSRCLTTCSSGCAGIRTHAGSSGSTTASIPIPTVPSMTPVGARPPTSSSDSPGA